MRRRKMYITFLALLLTAGIDAASSCAQESPPPLTDYLLDESEEIALARSAAPAELSGDAAILVLREHGYDNVKAGTNGFTCLVQRSWCNPTAWGTDMFWNVRIRAPICYNPEGTRAVLADYLMRTDLARAGRTMAQIDTEIRKAYGTGELKPPEPGALAYMFSSGQWLGPAVGAWKPHMMVYLPYLTDAEAGGFPLGSVHPHMFLGAGRPDAALVIAVPEFVDPVQSR